MHVYTGKTSIEIQIPYPRSEEPTCRAIFASFPAQESFIG